MSRLPSMQFPFTPSVGIVLSVMLATPSHINAEIGYVMVQVTDLQGNPVNGVQLEIEGYGGSSTSGTDGRVRLSVSPVALPGDSITLTIINPPKGKQLAIVSPWTRKAQIPRFEEKPDNYIAVVVMSVGQRRALEDGRVLRSAAARIGDTHSKEFVSFQNNSSSPRFKEDLFTGSPRIVGVQLAKDKRLRSLGFDSKAPLDQVAAEYGFVPEALDRAIREWGGRANNPFDAGIAAYYEGNVHEAIPQLRHSLEIAQTRLEASHKNTASYENSVADSAFFLGSLLFQQGQYRKAAAAYQNYLKIRPEDPFVLDSVARCFQELADYKMAERYSDRAEIVAKKIYGANDPRLASVLDSSGLTALLGGEAIKAERLFDEAINIDKQSDPEGSANLAATVNNLGIAFQNQHRYAEAQSAYQEAIAMNERLFGANNLEGARYRNNLAMLWDDTGQYGKAEQEFRSLLELRERLQGPDHPQVGTTLENLSHALVGEGRFEEAKVYAMRALANEMKSVGPNSGQVAADLYALAQIKIFLQEYQDAEGDLLKALKIYDSLEGPNSLDCARTLSKLADTSWRLGKLSQAEQQSSASLEILQQKLSPADPFLAVSWEQAAYILRDERKFTEAIAAFKKALEIANAGLGPDHHTTRRIQGELKDLEK